MSTEYCSIQRAPKITKQFVASVTIPVGFHINSNPEDDQHDYHDYLTIDRNALDVNIVEELRDSEISIPDFTNPGSTTKMACKSKVRVIKLVGPLFYNVIATGFLPVASAQLDKSEGAVIISPATAFSSSGTVEIDYDLGYTCYECPFEPSQIAGFKVTLVENEPFLVTETGGTVPYKVDTPKDFINCLDGKNTVIIHYPFSIIMSSEEETDPEVDPEVDPVVEA